MTRRRGQRGARRADAGLVWGPTAPRRTEEREPSQNGSRPFACGGADRHDGHVLWFPPRLVRRVARVQGLLVCLCGVSAHGVHPLHHTVGCVCLGVALVPVLGGRHCDRWLIERDDRTRPHRRDEACRRRPCRVLRSRLVEPALRLRARAPGRLDHLLREHLLGRLLRVSLLLHALPLLRVPRPPHGGQEPHRRQSTPRLLADQSLRPDGPPRLHTLHRERNPRRLPRDRALPLIRVPCDAGRRPFPLVHPHPPHTHPSLPHTAVRPSQSPLAAAMLCPPPPPTPASSC